MRVTVSIAIALFAADLVAAPAPVPKPARPDDPKAVLEKMQGKWARTTLSVGRQKHAQKAGEGLVTATITGDRMEFSANDTWTIALDTKASPPRIDLKGAVPGVAKLSFMGVYRLEGDKLTICWRPGQVGQAQAQRPDSFDPQQKGVWFQVFERVKP